MDIHLTIKQALEMLASRCLCCRRAMATGALLEQLFIKIRWSQMLRCILNFDRDLFLNIFHIAFHFLSHFLYGNFGAFSNFRGLFLIVIFGKFLNIQIKFIIDVVVKIFDGLFVGF